MGSAHQRAAPVALWGGGPRWGSHVSGFFFSSRRRHTRFDCDWSSDVCSSDLETWGLAAQPDSPLRQLAGEIELRVAEFTSGHRTEEDLRSLLQALLQREAVSKRDRKSVV